MTLPNKLTVARMAMVPIFVVFLMIPEIPFHYFWACLIFMVASYTDHLDGMIARKQGLITTFGEFMDPLADKVLIVTALVCFVRLDLCRVWFVVLIIAREFMVTGVRLVAMEHGKVIAANKWGKLKTISQIIAVLAILVFQSVAQFQQLSAGTVLSLNMIGNFLVGICCFFTLLSGGIYLKENWKIVSDTK